MKKIILDANAILRYIIDDIKEQADIVQEILENYEVKFYIFGNGKYERSLWKLWIM